MGRFTVFPVVALTFSAAVVQAAPSHQQKYPASLAKKAAAEKRSTWTLDLDCSNGTFFDCWEFYTDSDPTHGSVNYVSKDDAAQLGLAEINGAGNAILTVDSYTQVVTENNGNRNSIRMTSDYTMNGGNLVIIDAIHIPTGCGTWPAFWFLGSGVWPAGGELDMIEGVNVGTYNLASAHTAPGCYISSTLLSTSTNLETGSFDSTDCSSADTSNQGCGERSTLSNSFGPGFNSNGGGVYAFQWDSTEGLFVYFFPRGSVPSDITDGSPEPTTWTANIMGNWPAANCDPATYFKDLQAIFDISLCGDWAGSSAVWSQSCAASTEYPTCAEFVLSNGDQFTEAYFEVSYVKFYKSS